MLLLWKVGSTIVHDQVQRDAWTTIKLLAFERAGTVARCQLVLCSTASLIWFVFMPRPPGSFAAASNVCRAEPRIMMRYGQHLEFCSRSGRSH